MSKVRNVIGNATRAVLPNGYQSFIDVWKEKSGQRIPDNCPVCGNRFRYDNDRLQPVGAHVQKVHANATNKWYLTPICKSCNSSQGNAGEFDVDDRYLVEISQL